MFGRSGIEEVWVCDVDEVKEKAQDQRPKFQVPRGRKAQISRVPITTNHPSRRAEVFSFFLYVWRAAY